MKNCVAGDEEIVAYPARFVKYHHMKKLQTQSIQKQELQHQGTKHLVLKGITIMVKMKISVQISV